MAVHPESVLDVGIKAISQALYDKLADMENTSYLNPNVGTISDHKALWQDMNAAWLGYKTAIILPDNKALSAISALYSFTTLHVGYNAGTQADFDACKTSGVFNSGGLIDEILGYPNDYYNDLVVPVPAIPPDPLQDLTPKSPHMTADIPKISPAAAGDLSRFDDLVSNRIPTIIQKHQMTVMFGEPTLPTVMLTKGEMWDTLFIEMGWKPTLESMGKGSLIPPRP